VPSSGQSHRPPCAGSHRVSGLVQLVYRATALLHNIRRCLHNIAAKTERKFLSQFDFAGTAPARAADISRDKTGVVLTACIKADKAILSSSSGRMSRRPASA
jgi:hypothetical protein